MAVDAYLVVTLNDGTFLKSENVQAINSASRRPIHSLDGLR